MIQIQKKMMKINQIKNYNETNEKNNENEITIKQLKLI